MLKVSDPLREVLVVDKQKARLRVIDTAFRMSAEGLVKGTWGNVSMRIPGQDLVVITPSGMNYAELEADDAVIIDISGAPVEGRWKPSTESPLHTSIYRSRTDVGAVVHTHSTYATAFAAAKKPIPVITEEMAQVIGGAVQATDSFAGCGSPELTEQAIKALGTRNAALLANHGVVGVGRDLAEALRVCIIVEKTAQIALLAQSLGGWFELSSTEAETIRSKFIAEYGQK